MTCCDGFNNVLNFGSGRVVARGVAAHLKIKWLVPLAPRSDGSKVTFYSRKCASRFVRLFRVHHRALENGLAATYMYCKHVAQEAYKERMEAWEGLGSERKGRQPRQPGTNVQTSS